MYRITHDQDTYIAEGAEFETGVIVLSGAGGAITYRTDKVRRLELIHVTHLNGDPVPERCRVPPIQLGPGDTVTIEPFDPAPR